MSAAVFAFSFSSRRKSESRPWQNHELAEFYRVIDILGRAGLGIVPDMGVSDEGDPWFAFCLAETGDVVVHCARVDSVFLATSTATNEVFRGADIREVINAIIRSRQFALVTLPPDNGRLYLHPSVVFIAFIAAALLFSKHASAHDFNSDHSGTITDIPLSLAKIIATLKGVVGESAGSALASTPNFDQMPTGQSEPEVLSLAGLMSAAMTVIAPVIQGSDGLLTSDTTVAPLPNSESLSNPHEITALPLFEIGVQSTSILQPVDPSSSLNVSLASSKTIDLTPSFGNLVISVINTDIAAQANSGSISFLSASEIFNPTLINHTAIAPFHNGLVVVSAFGDASSPTIQQPPPSVYITDLNEITPIALTLLFGNSSTTPPAIASIVSSWISSHVVESSTSSASTAVTLASVGPSPSTDTLANSSATPATIDMVANPTASVGQLLDYALTSHPINAPLMISSGIVAELQGIAQPVRLVVFDTTSFNTQFFEFVPGVYFVNDHDLGLSPNQISSAQLVTVDLPSGGTMQLLGVVNTAHLTL